MNNFDIIDTLKKTGETLYKYLLDLNYGNIYKLPSINTTKDNLLLCVKVNDEITQVIKTIEDIEKTISTINATRLAEEVANSQNNSNINLQK